MINQEKIQLGDFSNLEIRVKKRTGIDDAIELLQRINTSINEDSLLPLRDHGVLSHDLVQSVKNLEALSDELYTTRVITTIEKFWRDFVITANYNYNDDGSYNIDEKLRSPNGNYKWPGYITKQSLLANYRRFLKGKFSEGCKEINPLAFWEESAALFRVNENVPCICENQSEPPPICESFEDFEEGVRVNTVRIFSCDNSICEAFEHFEEGVKLNTVRIFSCDNSSSSVRGQKIFGTEDTVVCLKVPDRKRFANLISRALGIRHLEFLGGEKLWKTIGNK